MLLSKKSRKTNKFEYPKENRIKTRPMTHSFHKNKFLYHLKTFFIHFILKSEKEILMVLIF